MSNQYIKHQSIIISFLFLWSAPLVPFQSGRSFLLARPQGEHAERELVGWQDTINLSTDCENYGSFTIQPIYSKSIRSKNIAEYFFGCNNVVFSGNQVKDRGESDILADYCGLPQDFQSTVQFSPLVQNVNVDVNLFVGLDTLCRGMYFRMHMPFVHTWSTVRINECVQEPGSLPYKAGYMASSALPYLDLNHSVTDWFQGKRGFGDLQPLKYGLIDGNRSESGLADLFMAVGWNPVLTERYHFGFNARVVIPTGNSSKGVYLFEPMLGNGRHWECGIGLTGHSWMYESCNGDHNLFVYGDANFTYLFSSCQKRSFDFKQNGIGSRYILIEEVGAPIVQGLVFDASDPNPISALNQYHGRIMPAINQTTLNVRVGVALQADIVLKFAYRYKQFSFDFGYDFWGRTSEQFKFREQFPENSFAIKGDALVYGFATTTNQFIALNATQSQATVHAGQGSGNQDFKNANADNSSEIAFDFDSNQVSLGLFGQSTELVNGSNQSILIKDCDIDNLSALSPAALSHTFFTHFHYRWDTSRCVEPSIGFGAEISVDGSGARRKNALSEWAIWMKIGVST